MKKASFHHSGFSLLELSVVLVIISLIAGGVVFGKNLVRQAAVRSVVTDALKYQSAVQLFRDTYNALPGDFSTATSLWGAAAACMPTADFSGTATCNGNGNGRLFINDLDPGNTAPEWWYAWHHLSNAKMVEGTFTGRPGTAGTWYAVPNRNVPDSRISGAGFTMMSVQIGAENDTRWFSGNYATILVFGGNSGNQETYIPVLTAEEAFNIDEKMDDGKPGIGTVRGFKFNLCVNPDSASTAAQKQAATYDRTLASRNCSLIFSLAGDPG